VEIRELRDSVADKQIQNRNLQVLVDREAELREKKEKIK